MDTNQKEFIVICIVLLLIVLTLLAFSVHSKLSTLKQLCGFNKTVLKIGTKHIIEKAKMSSKLIVTLSVIIITTGILILKAHNKNITV